MTDQLCAWRGAVEGQGLDDLGRAAGNAQVGESGATRPMPSARISTSTASA
jgi:hypothetical protein